MPRFGRRRHSRVHVGAACDELSDELEAVDVAGSLRCRIVASVQADLAHGGDLMQRRPPLRRGVRIGARVEQHQRQLVVRVARRQQKRVESSRVPPEPPRRGRQRRPPGSASLTLAPAAISAFATSSRPSRTANRNGVKPPVERAFTSAPRSTRVSHDWRVAFGGRPHQRRLPPARLLRVDVRAVRQQQLDGLETARPRGRHQGGFTTWQGGVRVGAGVEQQTDQRRVAVHAGDRQRRHRRSGSPPSRWRRRGSAARRRHVVDARGPVQRRRAVDLGRVDIHALLEQPANRRRVRALTASTSGTRRSGRVESCCEPAAQPGRRSRRGVCCGVFQHHEPF